MAKRELITREEAIKTVSRWIKADMTLGLSLFEMMMNEIPIITEQEIVKPYLEKLLLKLKNCAYEEPEGAICFCEKEPTLIVALDDIENEIDNLLSE